jgi:hypothetical protein
MDMTIEDREFSGYYVPDRQHPGMTLLDLDSEEWYAKMCTHQKQDDIRFDRVVQHFFRGTTAPPLATRNVLVRDISIRV